jgi:hypothetical protein
MVEPYGADVAFIHAGWALEPFEWPKIAAPVMVRGAVLTWALPEERGIVPAGIDDEMVLPC